MATNPITLYSASRYVYSFTDTTLSFVKDGQFVKRNIKINEGQTEGFKYFIPGSPKKVLFPLSCAIGGGLSFMGLGPIGLSIIAAGYILSRPMFLGTKKVKFEPDTYEGYYVDENEMDDYIDDLISITKFLNSDGKQNLYIKHITVDSDKDYSLGFVMYAFHIENAVSSKKGKKQTKSDTKILKEQIKVIKAILKNLDLSKKYTTNFENGVMYLKHKTIKMHPLNKERTVEVEVEVKEDKKPSNTDLLSKFENIKDEIEDLDEYSVYDFKENEKLGSNIYDVVILEHENKNPSMERVKGTLKEIENKLNKKGSIDILEVGEFIELKIYKDKNRYRAITKEIEALNDYYFYEEQIEKDRILAIYKHKDKNEKSTDFSISSVLASIKSKLNERIIHPIDVQEGIALVIKKPVPTFCDVMNIYDFKGAPAKRNYPRHEKFNDKNKFDFRNHIVEGSIVGGFTNGGLPYNIALSSFQSFNVIGAKTGGGKGFLIRNILIQSMYKGYNLKTGEFVNNYDLLSEKVYILDWKESIDYMDLIENILFRRLDVNEDLSKYNEDSIVYIVENGDYIPYYMESASETNEEVKKDKIKNMKIKLEGEQKKIFNLQDENKINEAINEYETEINELELEIKKLEQQEETGRTKRFINKYNKQIEEKKIVLNVFSNTENRNQKIEKIKEAIKTIKDGISKLENEKAKEFQEYFVDYEDEVRNIYSSNDEIKLSFKKDLNGKYVFDKKHMEYLNNKKDKFLINVGRVEYVGSDLQKWIKYFSLFITHLKGRQKWLTEYGRIYGNTMLTHKLLMGVVDELGALMEEPFSMKNDRTNYEAREEIKSRLNQLSQLGRSSGVKLFVIAQKFDHETMDTKARDNIGGIFALLQGSTTAGTQINVKEEDLVPINLTVADLATKFQGTPGHYAYINKDTKQSVELQAFPIDLYSIPICNDKVKDTYIEGIGNVDETIKPFLIEAASEIKHDKEVAKQKGENGEKLYDENANHEFIVKEYGTEEEKAKFLDNVESGNEGVDSKDIDNFINQSRSSNKNSETKSLSDLNSKIENSDDSDKNKSNGISIKPKFVGSVIDENEKPKSKNPFLEKFKKQNQNRSNATSEDKKETKEEEAKRIKEEVSIKKVVISEEDENFLNDIDSFLEQHTK